MLSFIHLLAAGQDNAEGIGAAVERYNKSHSLCVGWAFSPINPRVNKTHHSVVRLEKKLFISRK